MSFGVGSSMCFVVGMSTLECMFLRMCISVVRQVKIGRWPMVFTGDCEAVIPHLLITLIKNLLQMQRKS